MSVDSSKIEEIAVSAVKSLLVRVPNLRTRINENDKTPSVDGVVEVYSSESSEKRSQQGEVVVQVKGRNKKPKTLKHLKYEVETADLDNFERVHGGALFFVVTVNDRLEATHIFYRQFLPLDIERIRKNLQHEGQEHVTVKFFPFPEDVRSIERIFQDHLRDKVRQKSTILIGGANHPEELEKCGVAIGSYTWTKTLFKGESPLDTSPYENGTYVYAVDSATGLKYAIDRFGPVESISEIITRPGCVSSGDITLNREMEIAITKPDDICIAFGGFRFHFKENAGTINFTETGGFRQRLDENRLFNNIAKTGEVYFDGKCVANGHIDNDVTFEMTERIAADERYVRAEDAINSKIDWNPASLTVKDLWAIETIYKCIYLRNPYKATGDMSLVANLDIGSTRVKLICIKRSDGRYDLHDMLHGEYGFAFGSAVRGANDEEQLCPVPVMLALDKQDFQRVVNLDIRKFTDDLVKYPLTEETHGQATLKLLDMLIAFDEGAVCGKDLIECCLKLAEALFEIDNSDDSFINLAQTRKRMGPLEISDKEVLMKIIGTTCDDRTKAAEYLLLNQTVEAETYLKRLTKDKRDEFDNWPISHFQDLSC